MTSRGSLWDEPEDGYTGISPLPLDPSMLEEELDDLAERSSRGELRPEKRAESKRTATANQVTPSRKSGMPAAKKLSKC